MYVLYIQVTTLQRDVSSGSALQEISFWVSMDHALNRLRSKRESPEVVLTLDVLKAGKRFHTTISFDSDTGLKKMLDKVMDYNLLMKDFPIKDLLAADSLSLVSTAIGTIFQHLKKLRNTSYPTDRAIALVEAISRDLLSQMLKLLNTHKLMVVAYRDFDPIIKACREVFSAWEEEYEKFTTLLRDLMKKKRDESMKFHFRFNLAHKKLETRLNQMKE